MKKEIRRFIAKEKNWGLSKTVRLSLCPECKWSEKNCKKNCLEATILEKVCEALQEVQK